MDEASSQSVSNVQNAETSDSEDVSGEILKTHPVCKKYKHMRYSSMKTKWYKQIALKFVIKMYKQRVMSFLLSV